MRNKGRNAQQEPVFTGPGVSELLKTSRERAGQDLQTVAQVLRIRLVYLEAIEAGRYEDLPGKTYVVGFVRAYSDYLGLDADEVVKRFKEEVNGLEGRSELMFPSPVTEQSVPGGAIILIGLIVLAAAYGGWYFLSSQDRSVAELVPDLPAKFAEMVDKVKESKKEEPAPAAAQTEQPATEKPVAATQDTAVSEADTQDMAQKAREALEKAKAEEKEVEQVVETVKAEATSTAQAVEEKVEAAAEKVEEVAKTVEETAEKAVAEVKEEVAETAAKVEEKVEETVTAVSEEKVEEVKVVEEAPKPQPMTEKLLLKAVDYSWIQVTDQDGNVLHTQVLNEGEEYQVPATKGLILRTGNAGGLEIFVDGKKAPSIGAAGEVRRKVLLSPEKLLAGKAVES